MKRCMACGEPFKPDSRTRRFQKVCSKSACRRKRKREADQRWRAKNPDYEGSRRDKLRRWAAAYPDYWRHWRATNPDYTECNREQSRQRMNQKRLMFAKQDAIREERGVTQSRNVGHR